LTEWYNGNEHSPSFLFQVPLRDVLTVVGVGLDVNNEIHPVKLDKKTHKKITFKVITNFIL
jgi:hypothetical protein